MIPLWVPSVSMLLLLYKFSSINCYILILSFLLSISIYKLVKFVGFLSMNRYVPIPILSAANSFKAIRIFCTICDTNLLVRIRINILFYQPVYTNSYI